MTQHVKTELAAGRAMSDGLDRAEKDPASVRSRAPTVGREMVTRTCFGADLRSA
jgi:hypothetical protein